MLNEEYGGGSSVPVQERITVENIGTPPWGPYEESTPASEPEAKPDPAVLSAACAAYLSTLNEHQSLIEAYSGWYGSLKCVALVDIMGDSVPELIFVEAASVNSSDSYLNILTYQNGQVVTLAREYWDFFAGSGLSFNLYQAAGSKELRSYSQYGDSYIVKEWIRFVDKGEALSLDRVKFDNSDGTVYTHNGAAVNEAEYSRIHETIPKDAEQLVMSNIYSNTLSMSCSDAKAFLQENI